MFEKRGLESHQKACKTSQGWTIPYTNVSWCIAVLIVMLLAPQVIVKILEFLAAVTLLGNGAGTGGLAALGDAAKKVGEVVDTVTEKPQESAKAAENAFYRLPTTFFDAMIAMLCGLNDYNKPRLINGECVSQIEFEAYVAAEAAVLKYDAGTREMKIKNEDLIKEYTKIMCAREDTTCKDGVEYKPPGF